MGSTSLVKYFISKGANEWNRAMREAAYGGHRDLVEYLISKGATYWNGGMYGAFWALAGPGST